MSGRRITTVSLDEKTAHIAKSMPNFSHFVRECLMRHHANSLNVDECNYIKQERFGIRCVPRVVGRPTCFLCWPHGRPSEGLVKQFLVHKDLAKLDRQTESENWQLANIDQNFSIQSSSQENVGLQGGGKRSFRGKIADRIKALFRFG